MLSSYTCAKHLHTCVVTLFFYFDRMYTRIMHSIWLQIQEPCCLCSGQYVCAIHYSGPTAVLMSSQVSSLYWTSLLTDCWWPNGLLLVIFLSKNKLHMLFVMSGGEWGTDNTKFNLLYPPIIRAEFTQI